MKILVVDDDSGIRKLTVNALTYCVNREILSFGDGLSAWQYLEEGGDADIVISDVDMPLMNGFELLSKCKAKWVDNKGASKFFILMSGRMTNEKKAELSGADAFLGKPFAINDLFNIVQCFVVE